MQLFFDNQGNNTYLVYQIDETDQLDTMSLGMLTNNTIPGFAPTSFTQMDTVKYIQYNVTAKVSVAQLFASAVNKKRLVGVFSGIVDALLAAEDYMLDPDSLLLDLEYIFADVSTCEAIVICLPVLNSDRGHQDLGAFFKNIIFNTQFDQTENCDHVAQILNYLNSAPVLSLGDFKELLEQIGKDSHSTPIPQARPAVQQQIVQPAAVQQPLAQPAATQQPVVRPVVQQPVQPQPVAKPVQPIVPPVTSAPAKTAPSNTSSTPQGKEEKNMSVFYLLQHYNKENAAIYKAQQEAKKNNAAKPTPQKAPAQPRAAFAIPGQESAPVAPKPVVQPSAKPAESVVMKPAAKTAGPVGEKCANCGASMMSNQMFCTACGTSRGAAGVAVPASPPVVTAPPVRPDIAINFGETTVLSTRIGETTVLGADSVATQNNPHLIRTKNNEKILLNKPVFRIGKERSYVDYFVGDNAAISRSHANIVNHDGEFFIVDTNSTNHTFVNGGMIHSNTETKLSHGTKIRLANEDFEFKMY